MPRRSYSASEEYRFGFNGQEKSPEISNGHTTAKFWEYESRIARRWNVDPRPVTSISPYATFQGNPILNVDINGDTIAISYMDRETGEEGFHIYRGDEKIKNLPKDKALRVTVRTIKRIQRSGADDKYNVIDYLSKDERITNILPSTKWPSRALAMDNIINWSTKTGSIGQ